MASLTSSLFPRSSPGGIRQGVCMAGRNGSFLMQGRLCRVGAAGRLAFSGHGGRAIRSTRGTAPAGNTHTLPGAGDRRPLSGWPPLVVVRHVGRACMRHHGIDHPQPGATPLHDGNACRAHLVATQAGSPGRRQKTGRKAAIPHDHPPRGALNPSACGKPRQSALRVINLARHPAGDHPRLGQ